MTKTNILSDNCTLKRKKIIDKMRARIKSPCKKILLVQPVQITEDGIDIKIALNKRYYMYPPYSLGILTTNLKKRGYDVSILDLNFDLFEIFFENSTESFLNDRITDIWKKRLEEKIKNFEPDLIGLSCTFTMGHDLLIRTADFSKSINPKIPIIAGGVHVTNAPEMVLKEGKNIDFISLYEGDISFCDFVDIVNNKKPEETLSQIGTIIDKQYIRIDERTPPAADELNTIPDYDNLSIGEYNNFGEIGTFRYWRNKDAIGSPVLSNKGCRARCTFCSVANFNGSGVRGRSVKSVVDEIQRLKEDYNIDHITWLDDDLFYNTKRTLSLFEEISNRKLDITWDASNGIIGSAAVMHEELIHAASESGCIGMYFGIESGNDQILRKIKKPSAVKHFLKLGKLMDKYPNIFTRGFLIMGFPNETLGQIYDTIKLSREMNLDWYTVQLLTPLPSTAIYNEMVEAGTIEGGSLNIDGEGFTMFSVRESERQRRKERQQKTNAKEFHNMFKNNLDRVPTKSELTELWLLVDYLINYQRIIETNDRVKLKKLQRFLTDVSDRMTIGNPISNLFLGIVETKLGSNIEADRRKLLAKEYVSESKYWQTRFDSLNLMELL